MRNPHSLEWRPSVTMRKQRGGPKRNTYQYDWYQCCRPDSRCQTTDQYLISSPATLADDDLADELYQIQERERRGEIQADPWVVYNSTTVAHYDTYVEEQYRRYHAAV